jgi:hypothetical protein
LSTTVKPNANFLPSDLLSESEVNLLIQRDTHLMFKACIALMDEVEPRPGELLQMMVGNVIFDGEDVVSMLGHAGGKTGERLVSLVEPVPLVSK